MVKILTFKQIKPIWKYNLWPNIDDIQPMSSIQFMGGNDMTIYEKYKPTFFGLALGNKIIGVNSGFKTKDNHYRSRGIWVDPQYRGHKISKVLFDKIDELATEEDCNIVWSIPRQSALFAYEKSGYTKVSDWFEEGMEYGPNCYVSKTLS